MSVAKDWDAVARAIDGRMQERDLTQTQLAASAHVSLETVRELRNNLRPRRRNPRAGVVPVAGAVDTDRRPRAEAVAAPGAERRSLQ